MKIILNHSTENCTLYWNLFSSIVYNQNIMTPPFPPHSKSPTVWTEISTLLLFCSTRHGSISVIISRIYMSYRVMITYGTAYINPLNTELNPICHLLSLLGAHPIFHISRIRVNVAYISCSGDLILIILFYFVKNFYAWFQFDWYNLKFSHYHHVCNISIQRIINMYCACGYANDLQLYHIYID
jgi:hypothetical protein